ncbi:glycosyltransferase [Halolamina sediminis]|uniref:glycosyltransferase n=1 Tax=Halolamina sediminis TaxID=1480675 RepID=UPI0009AE9D0C|nr:glycosyltransferase [Halolamina sediminis]
MNVTYLINTLSVGGAERGMARLLSGLPPDQFDVTVVALATRGGRIVEQLPENVRVVDLDIESPLEITRLRTVWNEISETDVLVTSLYHATQIGRIFGTLRRVPIILSWRHNENLKTATRQRLFGLLSPLDTAVLADSNAAKSGAIKSGVAAEKIRRVPIAGIDPSEYSPVTHRPKERVTIGTVGRLTSQKNMHAVLDIAANLKQEPIEFRIAGRGPQRDELQRRIQENSLSNVTLEGFVDSVPEFLENLDIYFQPSIREGLCITVVEAMATGLPVVASNVGGITESVVPGETGYLEEPSSTDAFTQHLLDLTTDPERRAAYGTASRRRVVENYSQERLVEEFLNVLDEVGAYNEAAEDESYL